MKNYIFVALLCGYIAASSFVGFYILSEAFKDFSFGQTGQAFASLVMSLCAFTFGFICLFGIWELVK